MSAPNRSRWLSLALGLAGIVCGLMAARLLLLEYPVYETQDVLLFASSIALLVAATRIGSRRWY